MTKRNPIKGMPPSEEMYILAKARSNKIIDMSKILPEVKVTGEILPKVKVINESYTKAIMDIEFYIVVGFQIKESEIYNTFRSIKSIPDKFHMEDRFCPKTGKKVEPVKVIDEEGYVEEVWNIDGEIINLTRNNYSSYVNILGWFRDKSRDLEMAVLSLLEKKLKCYVRIRQGVLGESFYDFFLHPVGDCDIECNTFSVYNASISVADIIRTSSQLEELAYKMRQLGLKPSESKVYISMDG